eukprot:CAMPEP_0184486734 /NCGR_PEP_ID=MMETSP0113_2-20130426/8435_1 /TAXON_ID=91329 /ORGANISM="Norrisiella sphaerica, Strain BC52" /LENGTH=306 /DNA_ID=CAMNT_0026868749 /DNA_START=355 /DNA_END=1275 /DNA_ORIENTATION=-
MPLTESQCPGDRPESKSSCTLCTLDGYVWCPRPNIEPGQPGAGYEGSCQLAGVCQGLQLLASSHTEGRGSEHHHHDHHGMMHEDEDRRIARGIHSVEECQDLETGFSRSIVEFFRGLIWMSMLFIMMCVLGFFVLLFLRNLQRGRRAWWRAAPYVPPHARQSAPALALPADPRSQAGVGSVAQGNPAIQSLHSQQTQPQLSQTSVAAVHQGHVAPAAPAYVYQARIVQDPLHAAPMHEMKEMRPVAQSVNAFVVPQQAQPNSSSLHGESDVEVSGIDYKQAMRGNSAGFYPLLAGPERQGYRQVHQ